MRQEVERELVWIHYSLWSVWGFKTESGFGNGIDLLLSYTQILSILIRTLAKYKKEIWDLCFK